MQALCGLQGIFDLFNCKTPEFKEYTLEELLPESFGPDNLKQ